MIRHDFTQGSILKKACPFLCFRFWAPWYCRPPTARSTCSSSARFGSTSGLSAVSTGSQVLNLVTFVVTQFAMGVTVLIARYLGEKKPEQIGSVIGGAAVVFTLSFLPCLFTAMIVFRPPYFRTYAGSCGGCFTYHKLCKNLWKRYFLHCCLQPAFCYFPRAW